MQGHSCKSVILLEDVSTLDARRSRRNLDLKRICKEAPRERASLAENSRTLFARARFCILNVTRQSPISVEMPHWVHAYLAARARDRASSFAVWAGWPGGSCFCCGAGVLFALGAGRVVLLFGVVHVLICLGVMPGGWFLLEWGICACFVCCWGGQREFTYSPPACDRLGWPNNRKKKNAHTKHRLVGIRFGDCLG